MRGTPTMIGNKKIASLAILKVLQEFSDEDHPLMHNDIIRLINKKYHVSLQRKAVGENISLLESMDYDIVRLPKKGCYLRSRNEFDEAEVKYLNDAIFSSKTLTSKQAQNLSEKIYSMLSKYKRNKYTSLYKSSDLNRNNDNTFFYTIDVINHAIENDEKISFQYAGFDSNGKETLRAGGYTYVVSPYFLINNFGRYYLLCNYRNMDNLTTFRVDFIRNVNSKDGEKRYPLADIDPEFNISDYINNHIYIFSDVVSKCVIKIRHESVITAIKDWFGKNALITCQNDDLIAEITCDESAFYYWCLQYGENIEVLEPSSLVIKLSRTYKNMYTRYKDYLLNNEVKPDMHQDITTFLHNQLYKEINCLHSDKELLEAFIAFMKESLTANYECQKISETRLLIINKKNSADRYNVSLKYVFEKDVEEEMFALLDDIRLLEEDKNQFGGESYQVILTQNESYFEGKGSSPIKEMFRKTRKIPGKTEIQSPTLNKSVTLNNRYEFTWRAITNTNVNDKRFKYYILKIK